MTEGLHQKQSISLSNNQLFWFLNITVWLILGPVWYAAYTLAFGQTGLAYLVHPMLQSVLGILVSWPMRYIFRATWNKPIVIKLPVVVGTVLLFAFIWTAARLMTFIWLSGEEKNFLPEFGVWYFPGLLVFSCWAALYHGFRYNRFLQIEKVSLAQLEREKNEETLKRKNAELLAQEAQFKMLRYQLNPHFLFNTMNTISFLVNSGSTADASRIIDSLCSFLRDSLEGDPMHRVTLRSELDSLRKYLEIEKSRFEERLEIEFDVPEKELDFKVPGMLLQPLAENVIKHAVRPATHPITLRISARLRGEHLDLEIFDSGTGIPGLNEGELPAGGIGLRNVRDRLQTMYGNNFRFQLETVAGEGFRILIRMPAKRDDPAATRMLAVDANA
jgi:sensor histidine kinase YesM